MTANECLSRLLARLSFEGGDILTFDVDDVSDFFGENFNLFVKHDLLQEMSDARYVVCDGCDEYCDRPVEIYRSNYRSPARAFVTCELRDDVGRVDINFERLKQWQVSGAQLATFIARQIGVTSEIVKEDGVWRLGILSGKKHQAVLSLDLRNQAMILVNGSSLSLIELIRFSNEQFSFDVFKIKQMIDFGLAPAGKEQNKILRKTRTQMRNKQWYEEYTRLKKLNIQKSDIWICKKIAQLPMADGKDIDTIRRVISDMKKS